jgi:hypothetical protein
LVGTLRQFQKEEKTVGNKGQAQVYFIKFILISLGIGIIDRKTARS